MRDLPLLRGSGKPVSIDMLADDCMEEFDMICVVGRLGFTFDPSRGGWLRARGAESRDDGVADGTDYFRIKSDVLRSRISASRSSRFQLEGDEREPTSNQCSAYSDSTV